MQYKVQDIENNKFYALTNHEREIIRNKIRKGSLCGDSGEFSYGVGGNLTLVEKNTTINDLSEKAKKHLCKIIASNLLTKDKGETSFKKIIRINRGESLLTIDDLKTFNTPLGKNGITYIIIGIEAKIYFLKNNK